MGLARADDVIWVHDYHLMMLPKLIKDAALKVSIVFYMHVPFPTSQIFRYVRLHIHTKHTHSPHPKYSGMFGNIPNTPFKTHLSILIQYSDTLSSHSTLPYPTLSSPPFPVVILTSSTSPYIFYHRQYLLYLSTFYRLSSSSIQIPACGQRAAAVDDVCRCGGVPRLRSRQTLPQRGQENARHSIADLAGQRRPHFPQTTRQVQTDRQTDKQTYILLSL